MPRLQPYSTTFTLHFFHFHLFSYSHVTSFINTHLSERRTKSLSKVKFSSNDLFVRLCLLIFHLLLPIYLLETSSSTISRSKFYEIPFSLFLAILLLLKPNFNHHFKMKLILHRKSGPCALREIFILHE